MRDDLVVVDTSIALKWVIEEADSPLAEALLAEWIARGVIVLAPALLTYEVANAIYQHVRRGEITLDQAEAALFQLHTMGIVLEHPQDHQLVAFLSTRALWIARDFGLGPTYDTQFLALAEHEDCEYWTADHRFWATVARAFPRVRSLRDYHPASSEP